MQKIIPHIWFDEQAEEAVRFYSSVFEKTKTVSISRYNEVGYEIHGMKSGTVMTVEFEIEGYKMIALNGGPHFKLNPAISFFVICHVKDDVDKIWNKFSDGGKELMALGEYPFSQRYGWIEDKYGVSWQIIFDDKSKERTVMPCLMFTKEMAGKAEEAIRYYTSIFENSAVAKIYKYDEVKSPDRKDMVAFADFTLFGQHFVAMDGPDNHDFSFNEAVSLVVKCKNQKELDKYWNELSAVPDSEQCGWLKDRYGVSWQIIPDNMEEMINLKDEDKSRRLMQAVLGMKKIDIKKLEEIIT